MDDLSICRKFPFLICCLFALPSAFFDQPMRLQVWSLISFAFPFDMETCQNLDFSRKSLLGPHAGKNSLFCLSSEPLDFFGSSFSLIGLFLGLTT